MNNRKAALIGAMLASAALLVIAAVNAPSTGGGGILDVRTNGVRVALATNNYWDSGVTGYLSGAILHLGVSASVTAGGVSSNANQFAGVPLSIKNGAVLTNISAYAQTLPLLTASRAAVLNSSGNLTNAAGTPDGTKFLRDDNAYAAIPNTFDNVIVTNGVNKLRSLVGSAGTTNQIDVATGSVSYYWTNMVTNVVLQITNVWTASVTNRTIDFFFTGAPASSPDYTVTFTCPVPGGVAFRWGLWSSTNGATSFTVTNGQAVGVSMTLWETNLAECYFSAVR